MFLPWKKLPDCWCMQKWNKIGYPHLPRWLVVSLWKKINDGWWKVHLLLTSISLYTIVNCKKKKRKKKKEKMGGGGNGKTKRQTFRKTRKKRVLALFYFSYNDDVLYVRAAYESQPSYICTWNVIKTCLWKTMYYYYSWFIILDRLRNSIQYISINVNTN